MKLYGKNSVIERLISQPETIKRVFVQKDFSDIGYFRKKAQKRGIPVVIVPRSKMLKMARNHNTQGILVETEEFDYVPYDELLEKALKKKHSILFLDGLNDPQNLGSMIRSLACLGGFALVLPTHRSVAVTESVLRVACGGDNYVGISKVSNLSQSILKAKMAGFSIVGTVVKGGKNLRESKFSFPLALVIGSEQKGIRDIIRKKLDLEITIPMAQTRLSMNVSQAATILCYEIVRQRGLLKSN